MKYCRKTGLHSLCRRITCALLAAAVLAVPGSAAGPYYINGSRETLGTSLAESYALGSGGSALLGSGEIYAVTGTGPVLLEGGTPAGQEEFDYNIAHLSVDSTVSVAATTMRIGLYYYYNAVRDSSLASGNLQNVTGSGSGYAVGYYDKDRQFNAFGYTVTAEKVSVLIDRNMYYLASANTYYEGTESGVVVGCYHVRLDTAYAGYAEAEYARQLLGLEDSFIKYMHGSFYVMAGNFTDEAGACALQASIGGTVDSGTSYTTVLVRTGTDTILFEYDCGFSSYLALHPLNSSGKALTWFKGYRYYGDFSYMRTIGNKMTVVNYVDMEDYLIGVVASEMSESWPLEALKAQAVCARTYAARGLNSYNSSGFDLTADTYCQAYHGIGSAGDTVTQAVTSTAGLYLTYQGALCSTLYSASFGGGSESNINVNGTEVAYLKGVTDPFEDKVAGEIKNYTYTVTLTGSQLAAKLKSYGLSTVVSVEPTYSATGNAIALKCTDVNGRTATVKNGACRTALGMRSQHYTVEYSLSAGGWVFSGAGWGHNLGMSQWGAHAMAEYFGYTYDQILNHYYTGVSLSMGVTE